MIQVAPRLFVGNLLDCEAHTPGGRCDPEWAIIHACKDPCHRRAVGYTERALPSSHPQYLWAYNERANQLYLNLIDTDNPGYMPEAVIEEALFFLDDHLERGKQVLIHCNQGLSRAPSLAMLYLYAYAARERFSSFEEALHAFRQLYPQYAPRPGIYEHLRLHWQSYYEQGHQALVEYPRVEAPMVYALSRKGVPYYYG